MSLPNNVQNILNLLNAAYEGGELRINEDLPLGERGDTLADFLRIEVIEVAKGEDHPLQVVVDALRDCIGQLERCVAAIEYFDNEALARAPAELALEREVAKYTARFMIRGFAEGALDDTIHDLLSREASRYPGEFLQPSEVPPSAEHVPDDDAHNECVDSQLESAFERAQSAAGDKAASINNGGMESQIEYLLKNDCRHLLDELLAAGVQAAV